MLKSQGDIKSIFQAQLLLSKFEMAAEMTEDGGHVIQPG